MVVVCLLRTSSKQYVKSSDFGIFSQGSWPWDCDFYYIDDDPNAMKLWVLTFSNGVIAPHESLITAFMPVMFFEISVLKMGGNCSSVRAYRSLILMYLSPPCPVRYMRKGSFSSNTSLRLLRVLLLQNPMMRLLTREAVMEDCQQSTSTFLNILVQSLSQKEIEEKKWFFQQHGVISPIRRRMSSSRNPFALRC